VFRRKKNETLVREAIVSMMPRLWRFALSLSGQADLADDLAQATAVRAMERAEQLVDPSRVEAWVLTICRSIWLNELRAAAVRKASSLSTVPETLLIAPGPDPETNIFAAEVFTKVMELPEAQRETVVLVYVEGYSYKDAAEVLGIPIGTVMSRLSAARQKLKHLNAPAGAGYVKEVQE